LTNGWQFNGITTIESGLPFSPTLSNNASLNSDMSLRPNIIGDPLAQTGEQRTLSIGLRRCRAHGRDRNAARPTRHPGSIPGAAPRAPGAAEASFDPKTDSDPFFPLLMVMEQPGSEPAQDLAALSARLPRLYAESEDYYRHFFDTRLSAETPDHRFDDALRWAAIAIDQGRVRLGDETGLVAGYDESGDSARPGFGWFFGRDALWTSYAINGYGDFELTRQALEFLIRRQRSDGKIMHQYSQTGGLVDWKTRPYFYAAADSTSLFVMAMEDYVNVSGDIDLLQANWDAVRRAWGFTRAHDSDGDGIYENTEGTGWVESWSISRRSTSNRRTPCRVWRRSCTTL
jgi:hypothetical protein